MSVAMAAQTKDFAVLAYNPDIRSDPCKLHVIQLSARAEQASTALIYATLVT
jgi:hypothetical protein